MDESQSKLIYVGDPMCSWCWGIAPELEKLVAFCEQQGLIFEIKVGGLRPGGGDPWNHQMKEFLRHHWDQVLKATGQPFGYALLDKEYFNYDTEPACRLVVAARKWLGNDNMKWFRQLQELFYVHSKDLSDLSNIQELCNENGIDFELFNNHFQSEEVKQHTQRDFQITREWGINGYPTVVLSQEQKLQGIALGYSSYQQMKERILDHLSADSPV